MLLPSDSIVRARDKFLFVWCRLYFPANPECTGLGWMSPMQLGPTPTEFSGTLLRKCWLPATQPLKLPLTRTEIPPRKNSPPKRAKLLWLAPRGSQFEADCLSAAKHQAYCDPSQYQ